MPPVVLQTAMLVRILGAASKDDSRPALTTVYAADGDLVATDSYMLVVHPGAAAGIKDGPIPRHAIQFAKSVRAKDVTIDDKHVTIPHPYGVVTFERRDLGTFPDHKALLAKMEFDGSHMHINPELLVRATDGINRRTVRLTRNKVHNKALLISGLDGRRPGEPFAVVMPLKSTEGSANE